MTTASDVRPVTAGSVLGPVRPSGGVWHRVVRDRQAWVGAGLLAGIVLWALVGPVLRPWDATHVDLTAFGQPPSARHWFGTNDIGQDLYQQVLVGLRKSLVVALVAAPVATALAAVVGAVAGLAGGWVDRALMAGVDLMLVVPSFYLLVLCSPALAKAGWPVLALVIAALTWMIMARVVRAQTRSLRDRGFVRAARFAGAPLGWVVVRHIWPNLASLLVADVTVGVGAAVLTEATMSYFGIGVRVPDVSLGTLLAAGGPAAATRPWLFVCPALVLVVAVCAVSLLGDALRDALDTGAGRG
ncbi:MAG: ABC transporter permease [Micrococcales bacterium]|nr:ABC transporter permease [Micrococcales bacterium]